MEYSDCIQLKEIEYEALCLRCGGCCGAYDDPCKHLKKIDDSNYICEIYEKRLGLREATSGEKFYCVSLREILRTYWPKDHLCAYKRYFRV